MNTFEYTQENENEFQRLLKKYPHQDSMMLPALWLVQEQIGWISPESMIFIANKLNKQPIEVHSVVSFYTMFNLKPIGKQHIEICKTLSCMLMGQKNLKKYIKDTLNISPGQSTEDGLFHFSEVECLGACGGAPAMSIDGKYYENVTTSCLDNIIKKSSSCK